MKVNIRNLKNGSFTIDEEYELDVLMDYEALEPLKVNIKGNKVDDEYYLKINFSVLLNLSCDRCLDLYKYTLSDSFALTMSKNHELVYDEKTESVLFIDPDAHEVEISEEMHQELMVALPMKKLHNDDCKGLCDQCGKNLNKGQCSCQKSVDPRWDSLKDIKFNN